MSVFHKTMVWLGLVDDDEYDAQDDQYYLDDEYEEVPAAAAPAPTPARVAPARSAQTESPVTVFRGRNSRDEDEAPAVSEFALTGPGDLWILGNHRLLCGDSPIMETRCQARAFPYSTSKRLHAFSAFCSL